MASRYRRRAAMLNPCSPLQIDVAATACLHHKRKGTILTINGAVAELVEDQPLNLIAPRSNPGHRGCLCSSLYYSAALGLSYAKQLNYITMGAENVEPV